MTEAIPFKRPDPPAPVPLPDAALERLVRMVYETNLIAIDKTLAAIKRSPRGYAAAAARASDIAERIVRAEREVRLCL